MKTVSEILMILFLMDFCAEASSATLKDKHYSKRGGHYLGGHGSSHKDGHYINMHTSNHYTPLVK